MNSQAQTAPVISESLPQDCGGIRSTPHIEAPNRAFRIEWDSPGYVNVLRFAPTRRFASFLAETPEGALKVARYHHSRGNDFTVTREMTDPWIETSLGGMSLRVPPTWQGTHQEAWQRALRDQ